MPRPAVDSLLDTLAPCALVDAGGEVHARAGGRPVEPGDALVVATSGTTGEPRGAVLTHDAVHAAAQATSAALAVDPGRDRWLACLPLAHVGGLSVLTRALATATPLRLLPHADPGAVEAEGRRFEKHAELLRDRRILLGVRQAALFQLLDLLPTLGILFLLVVGAWRVYDGGVIVTARSCNLTCLTAVAVNHRLCVPPTSTRYRVVRSRCSTL
ncbi:MAG: AMP-binding protein [Actinobacteria bacterium]|nr:AMP-binding protein [Actinomycetota bacterium]